MSLERFVINGGADGEFDWISLRVERDSYEVVRIGSEH
jgi:hypothetical protein